MPVGTRRLMMMTQPSSADMSLSFLQSNSDAAGGTSWTFSSESLGAASADRSILVCFGSRKVGTASYAVSSVTVGGVSATEIISAVASSTNSTIASIWRADVPTGTTGDVVVTVDTSSIRAAIALYRCTGITSSSANATDTDIVVGVSNMSTAATAGGFAVACGMTGVSPATHTWLGFTEDCDFQVSGESSYFTSGSLTTESADTLNSQTTPANWNENTYVQAAWQRNEPMTYALISNRRI